MLYVKITLFCLIALLFIGCTSNVKVPDCNKKPIGVENVSSNSIAKNKSTKNVKEIKKGILYFNKSIALKAKLKKCGIKYTPWKDRLYNDLVLGPKLLSICKKSSIYTRGYILHSTLKKGISSFVRVRHVYISYYDSKKKIYKFIKSLNVGLTTKNTKYNGTVYYDKYYSSLIVKTIDEDNVDSLKIGSPYVYETKKQK